MPKVLLIDDDDSVRNVLALGLRARGYEVTPAPDGKEGARLFRLHPFDIVVTDLIMPEKEGLETIQDLLKEAPKTKIIAMSGGSPKLNCDFLTMAKQMGARKALHKPFSLKEFVAAVEEVIAEN